MRPETEPELGPGQQPKGSMPAVSPVRSVLILLAAALGIYVCYQLSLPFLSAMTWALALAVILLPAHEWVERRIPWPNVSAFVSVSVTALAAGVPLALMAQQLAREAAAGASYLSTTVQNFEWSTLIGSQTWSADAAAWIEQRFDPSDVLGRIAQWLTEQSTTLFRGSVGQAITFALTFYMLFYFLRDRSRAIGAIVAYSPLSAAETQRLLDRVAETVRASVFGTVVVGLVQGTLGGLIFAWLGLPAPIFWGLVMAVLAIIPVLGAFVIWVPAAAILALQGDWASAVILAAWGGLIIATVDNLLYPVLVGARLRLHTLVAFIGSVGGIVLFGAAGLVLGPAAIAVTMELVDILRQRSNSPATPASPRRDGPA